MGKQIVTFEQFQATRKECDDLTKVAAYGDLYGELEAGKIPKGFTYFDSLCIEIVQPWWPDEARARGKYYLILSNEEYISDDLAELERKLYEWAEHESFMVPKFREEFPDFPVNDMPPLPAGFEDSSWHNDACPSMTNNVLRLHIFIDYADPAKRDPSPNEDCPRFIVQPLDADGCLMPDAEELLATDKWDDVLDLIARKEYDAKNAAGEKVTT
jgi:hypothetical protein